MPSIPDILVISDDGPLICSAQQACGGHYALEIAPLANRSLLSSNSPIGTIVIDDQVLPETQRAERLAELRVRAPHASLIYVATNHSVEYEKWARAMGVNYYISKPIDNASFTAVLAKFLAHRAAAQDGSMRQRLHYRH